MTTQPRRWFRLAFGLRTMFVVVAVLAVPLGWLALQMQFVHERKVVLAEIARNADAECKNVKVMLHELTEDDRRFRFEHEAPIPRLRLKLGDKPQLVIRMTSTLDSTWIRRAEYAFPEAILCVKDYAATKVRSGDDTPGFPKEVAFRDSLYKPVSKRQPNTGTIFKTGLVDNSPEKP